MPTSRPRREPSSCSVRGRAFRQRASVCADGGTPRPERPTVIPKAVQLVQPGDDEDGVSMPAVHMKRTNHRIPADGVFADQRRCDVWSGAGSNRRPLRFSGQQTLSPHSRNGDPSGTCNERPHMRAPRRISRLLASVVRIPRHPRQAPGRPVAGRQFARRRRCCQQFPSRPPRPRSAPIPEHDTRKLVRSHLSSQVTTVTEVSGHRSPTAAGACRGCRCRAWR
jgi:hypothetical protein